MTQPESADEHSTPRLRARVAQAAAKAPARWFVTAGLIVLLAVSAVFGGLGDAAAKPLPQLAAGETYHGAQLDIAVSRVVLIDAFPEQYITPAPGNRLLVVVATVTDVWDRPVLTIADEGAADNLRPVNVPGIVASTNPKEVAVLSDGTSRPALQPNVPIELAYIWEVGASDLRQGQSLTVDVLDKVYRETGFITYGESYQNPFVAATVNLPIEDVGAGTDDQSTTAPATPAAPAPGTPSPPGATPGTPAAPATTPATPATVAPASGAASLAAKGSAS